MGTVDGVCTSIPTNLKRIIDVACLMRYRHNAVTYVFTRVAPTRSAAYTSRSGYDGSADDGPGGHPVCGRAGDDRPRIGGGTATRSGSLRPRGALRG